VFPLPSDDRPVGLIDRSDSPDWSTILSINLLFHEGVVVGQTELGYSPADPDPEAVSARG
jgi:hypothetical protein